MTYTWVDECSIRRPFQVILEGDFRGYSRLFTGGIASFGGSFVQVLGGVCGVLLGVNEIMQENYTPFILRRGCIFIMSV